MISVNVTISNYEDITDKLTKLGQSLYMFDSAMASIGKALVDYYSVVGFNSQGGVFDDGSGGSGVWAPLASAYAAWKAKKIGTPILVGTNVPHMRDQFDYTADSDSVYISNTADYFKYHQSSESRSSNLPRRQMIGTNDDIRSIINDIIDADIKQKIASA